MQVNGWASIPKKKKKKILTTSKATYVATISYNKKKLSEQNEK